MENILRFEYNKGKKEIFPSHYMVKNWLFKEGEEEEAELAHHIAKVAEKYGISSNDVMHMYPYILRMLKSNIDWAK